MVENSHLSIRTEQQPITAVARADISSPPLWKQLNAQEQKQMAQLLATLIRRVQSSTLSLKVNYDEQ